jgi:hypothetical protein
MFSIAILVCCGSSARAGKGFFLGSFEREETCSTATISSIFSISAKEIEKAFLARASFKEHKILCSLKLARAKNAFSISLAEMEKIEKIVAKGFFHAFYFFHHFRKTKWFVLNKHKVLLFLKNVSFLLIFVWTCC